MSESPRTGLEVWGRRLIYGYPIVLAASILLGVVAAVMINNDGIVAGDPVAIFSWFLLFPAYLLADAVTNAKFIGCPLRVAPLPLAQGIVIITMTGEDNPLAVSIGVAITFFLASLGVVAVVRAIRKSREREATRKPGGTAG